MLVKLSLQQIELELASLGGWSVEQGKLYREFSFQDFPRAFGFMASVASIAESMDHHPEWLNVFTSVKIWLTSHEVAGISSADIELARKISEMYNPVTT